MLEENSTINLQELFEHTVLVFIKLVVSYASYDWLVTVFISGYGNMVVMSQHVSQSYFKKEKENGYPQLRLRNLMQTLERVWSNLKVLMETLACGSGSHKL